ncbi:MAG TPA: hypothetical protein PKY10_02675, partial [Lentisphaeria bacterium]|nr:hypothetical protein [Lentisphaeria bacterium]
MDNTIPWRLLLALAVLPLLAAAVDLPQLNIWSGQDHKLNFQAQESWLLLAEHDRRLDGQAEPGQVIVRLPPL